MRKKSIDYGFSSGYLGAQITNITARRAWMTYRHSEPIVETPSEDRRKKLARELASTTRTIEGTDGAIEVGFLNTDVPAEDGITVWNMGIGGHFQHPVGSLENVALAAANSDQRIMVINNPGSGKSSLVPKEVMARMKETGRFTPQGEWMLRILGSELNRYGEITLEGNSVGARTAIGMAAAMNTVILDRSLARLTVFDPVGAKDNVVAGVIAAFASQRRDVSQYTKHSPYNPAKLDLLEPSPSNLFTAKGAFVQNMWNLPSAMTQQSGLVNDLASALGAIKRDGEVTIIQPEFSFATSEQMIATMVKAAIYSYMSDKDLRFRHIQIDNHSHPLLSAGAGPNALVTAYNIAK